MTTAKHLLELAAKALEPIARWADNEDAYEKKNEWNSVPDDFEVESVHDMTRGDLRNARMTFNEIRTHLSELDEPVASPNVAAVVSAAEYPFDVTDPRYTDEYAIKALRDIADHFDQKEGPGPLQSLFRDAAARIERATQKPAAEVRVDMRTFKEHRDPHTNELLFTQDVEPAPSVQVPDAEELTAIVHAAFWNVSVDEAKRWINNPPGDVSADDSRSAAIAVRSAVLAPIVEAFPRDMSVSEDDPPTCRKCGEAYDGDGERTPLCHDCAHSIVESVWSTINKLTGKK